MTIDDKIRNIQLATALGPVVPYAGIVDGHCQCGTVCYYDRPGKHPFGKDWREDATVDLEWIETMVREFPALNFGIIARQQSICLDLDIRPNKNGVSYLSGYGDLPETVSASTGSGGLHLYFRVPADIQNLKGLGQHGIDVPNVVTMAPGSLHLSGRYYDWLPGRSPLETELLELPKWVHDLLPKADSRRLGVAGEAAAVEGMEGPLGAIKQGKKRPDFVVRREWRNRVRTGALEGQRSHQDVYNASSLAFYTAHDWDQYLRIWFESDVRSGKVYPGNSEFAMLRLAFYGKRANWVSRPAAKRTRRPVSDLPNPALAKHMRQEADKKRNKPGKPRSEASKAILALHEQEPNLSATQIASRLTLKYQHVWRVLNRYIR